jgi:hypothetical protein
LPTAIYVYLRREADGSKSPNAPFVLDGEEARRDFQQIAKPFLCNECEGLFNTRGESWVLENCFRKPGEFRLQHMLLNGNHETRFRDGRILYADDFLKLDWRKLAYFAVSIFWRAGATSWKFGNKRLSTPIASRYEKRIRAYLLGDDPAQLPPQTVVSVAVTSKREPIAQAMHFPTRDAGTDFHHYRFAIPGMLFDMLLGPNIPQIPRDHCIVNGARHPIYLLDDNRLFAAPVLHHLPTSVPSEALKREFLFKHSEPKSE